MLTMAENTFSLLSDSYASPMDLPLYLTVPKDVPGNLRYRRRVLRAGYNSDAVAEELWIACKRDPLFWINTFVWTYNPRVFPKITTRPMVTYPFQDDALWDMLKAIIGNYDLQVEKSREMTATWDILMCFLWLAQFHPGLSFRVVSRNADLVDSREDPDALFCKLDFMLKGQPEWLISEDDYNRREMHLLFFETMSTIDGNSTTSDVARGGRCTAMALDEFAAVPNGHAMLRATRDTTSCRIFNSTPQGTGNAFYDLKQSKIRRIRLHWSQHPDKRRGLYRSEDGQLVIIDEEYHAVVRDSQGNDFIFPDNYPFILDGKLRSPWYDRECDRAAHPMEIPQELDIDYLGSDYQFFDAKVIDRIQQEDIRDPLVCGEIEFDHETCQPLQFVPSANGRIQLWMNPTPEGRFPEHIKVISGSDVAAGTGASNSASSFVNRETGEKIGEFADPTLKAEDFALYAIAMAKWFNQAFMIWDASGPHGVIFGNVVLERGYPNIYCKTSLDKISRTITDKPGYFMNPTPKAVAFGKYRQALKNRSFIQRSYHANKECLFYVQVIGAQSIEHTKAVHAQDPTGARANHGDRAVADIVANFAMDYLREKNPKDDEPQQPDNCFQARRQEYENKQRELQEAW